jgi:mRNA-degrading endonuclease toxin of MazEF toxin-antitoxin module
LLRGGLERDSTADCPQFLTIDKKKITFGPIGKLSSERIAEIEKAMKTTLALSDS